MASSTPPDSENSTLKRRARRRLLGSIALVLVAVIALPMIFDEERKPLGQDVSVQIPGQEPLTVKPPAARSGSARSVDPREPRADVASVAAPAGKSPAPEAKAAEKPSPRSLEKADAKAAADARSGVEARPQAEVKAATAKPADSKPAPPKAEESRVKAILDGKAAEDGAFAVQIGAFAAEDKVREARDKLAGAGFKTYTEKLDTKDGERTRVRAGPFAGREAAEAARDKIRALGFAGASVVAR